MQEEEQKQNFFGRAKISPYYTQMSKNYSITPEGSLSPYESGSALFSDAVISLIGGKAVSREVWQEEDTENNRIDCPCVYLEKGSYPPDRREELELEAVAMGIPLFLFEPSGDTNLIKYPMFNYISTDGRIVRGWTPNVLDQFANDWFELDPSDNEEVQPD